MLVKYRPRTAFNSLAHGYRPWMDTGNRRVSSGSTWNFRPSVDISEDKDRMYFQMEIPGFGKDDVKVTVNDENVLTISGEMKQKEENEGRKFWRVERNHSSFKRSFQLPERMDSDKVNARFENGILNITIEKLETAKPKEINIS